MTSTPAAAGEPAMTDRRGWVSAGAATAAWWSSARVEDQWLLTKSP